MKLNQIVNWLDCPGSISQFARTRIRGLSPCGNFVLLDWIRHSVRVDRLILADNQHWIYPATVNQWGEDGIDRSTGVRL